MLFQEGNSVPVRNRLRLWLKLEPQDQPKIYADITETASIFSLGYWLAIVFSAAIATLGLVLNSPAVIIGAMLISPLMGPIMATGLGLAAGDLSLLLKALYNLIASITLAVLLSAAIVWLLPFHAATSEILSRINPTLLDLGVALFSGLAGSVAVCRSNSGGITTLPGVAIAVALMPPLCAVGFGFGIGSNLPIMEGAGLLFLTNLVAIVATAFFVFLLTGMNSPEVRIAVGQFRDSGDLASTISKIRFGGSMAATASPLWSIGVLIILLAILAIPLKTALKQVTGEAVARGVVEKVVRGLVPDSDLVSQQVVVGRGGVAVRLVSTKAVSNENLAKAEKEIADRSGRKADVSVETIASQSDLAKLVQQMDAPAHPARSRISIAVPTQKSLNDIRAGFLERTQPVIAAVWPPETPLDSFDITFGPTGITANVRYRGAEKLAPMSLSILQRELRDKLQVPNLLLNTEQIKPKREEKR